MREGAINTKPKRVRSTLSKDAARRRYIEIGELAALEQIYKDSKMLDDLAIAVGPFARLDAGAVAARDKKTRGAITNLFGSQTNFQVEDALAQRPTLRAVEQARGGAQRCGICAVAGVAGAGL